MTGRLSVDFGTSNTVVAVWDDTRGEGIPLHVPDYGRHYQQEDEQISLVPSLVHYSRDGSRWIGNQVLRRNLYESRRTFRWMKRYIANRSPATVSVDGRKISHFDAGRDLLSSVLLFAAEEISFENEEVAFTVPVETFEHYEDWLTTVAETAGMPRFRLIDEPSAAALGYGAHIQPGDVYLIFDFGGGTLDVAVVLISEEDQSGVGRRCRVLGKAGADLGGMTIDQWLFEHVVKSNDRSGSDEDVRRLSRALLVECERAKERLSFRDRADVSVVDPSTGAVMHSVLTRQGFEELLDEHDFFVSIDRAVRRALNEAYERGYQEKDVKSVLMVGGSSQIPCVQRTLRRIFGSDRVRMRRPLDAVARGGAAFVAGVDFYDHIQHDYAIRYINRDTGEYDYRTLVQRGVSYPTTEPVDHLVIKASYDGQTQLGIAVFEIGERHRRTNAPSIELVFDPSGAARVMQVTPDDEARRTHFWMNEDNPTFLSTSPGVSQGEVCFDVEFNVDGNKRLLITVRDLRRNRVVHRDYPVVKLT